MIKFGNKQITEDSTDPMKAVLDTTLYTIGLPGPVFDTYLKVVMNDITLPKSVIDIRSM